MHQHACSRLVAAAAPLHTLVSHRDTGRRLRPAGPHIAVEPPEQADWRAFGTMCGEKSLGAEHIVFVLAGLGQGVEGMIACLKARQLLGAAGSIVLEPGPEE